MADNPFNQLATSIYVLMVVAALLADYGTLISGDRPFSIVSGITLSQPVQWGYCAFCLASVRRVGLLLGLDEGLNLALRNKLGRQAA